MDTYPLARPTPTFKLTDVAPYLSIATNYGFANYMFQSNEGPSFEAHQFLFTGTAAPVAPNTLNDYYKYFVQDNPPAASGCPIQTLLYWIDPTQTTWKTPPLGSECYAHDTLVTSAAKCSGGACDNGISWRYYVPQAGNIWDAPESIPEVCYGVNDITNVGTKCGTLNSGNIASWNNHMSFYSTMNNAPIFTDIASCGLQAISWVIPDGAWSDHPEMQGGPALGPSWVADIVNAIGNTSTTGNCNYWGSGSNPTTDVEPTAIFIVWDDWGGFYDHIDPTPYVYIGTGSEMSGFTCKYPNGWGCGYTHGFRVPFLVVSEYTGNGTIANPSGYISGECGVAGYPGCPNLTAPFVHDFGSILAFTEFNFGLLNIDQSGGHGYADYNALDWDSRHMIPPLSDFFGLYVNGTTPGRAFIPITSNYPGGFFQTYYNTHSPTGPDSD
jgi:phospholipase C